MYLCRSASSIQANTLACANIVRDRYCYTGDLLQLAATTAPPLGLGWPVYHTPIQLERLTPFLDSHPDRAYAAYIWDSLAHGFRIGFDHCSPLHSQNVNHPSALANPAVVDERIQAELSAGRLYGPVSPILKPRVHVSPMGLVPKPHQVNKFRLIVDLSHPPGASVNDGVSPSLCSLQYASVDEAVGTWDAGQTWSSLT